MEFNNTTELTEYLLANGFKKIVIIGRPASGKTYLSAIINGVLKSLTCIHTDDYQQYGYVDAMYKVLEAVKDDALPHIVEGIQGYRLLRKGVELNCYYPDAVIEINVTDEQVQRVYEMERDEKKLKYLKGFDGMHKKIITDYHEMRNDNKPQWLILHNQF